MAAFDHALAELARHQHSVFSVQQALDAGGTRKMLLSRERGGRIIKVDVDVYRMAGAPVTWESRVLGAALSAGPGARVSHRAAAALWGFEGFIKGTPELTIPRGRRYRRDDVRTHDSTDLRLCGTRHRSGIPVTDPARTILDLARRTGDRRLLQAIESARRQRLTSWSELIATLATHARPGRPGIRRLRRVIAANAHRAEITDTDFELLVLGLLVGHGLPEPVVHHELRAPDGTVLAEIDLAYPQLRIAIELDGSVHRRADVFERDRPRQNRILLDGWIILRFTWDLLRSHPEQIVAEVRAAIRLAEARA
jgi:predicted transcriptional regulator of viral defense system